MHTSYKNWALDALNVFSLSDSSYVTFCGSFYESKGVLEKELGVVKGHFLCSDYEDDCQLRNSNQ